MYTKAINYEKYVAGLGWMPHQLKTTNDAIWLHLQQMELRTDVRKIVVVDIK